MTTAPASTLLASLDEYQRAAVESRAPLLFVLAGPGSGKSRTITARVVHLIEQRQVPSHQILVLVFSRAAAAEIRARVVAAVGAELAAMLTVTTFHAWALRLLRACSPEYLRAHRWPESPWRVADDEEAEQVLRGLFQGPEARPEAAKTGIGAVRAASCIHAANGRWGHGPQWVVLDLWWKRLAEQRLVTHDRLLPAAWEASGDDPGAVRLVEDLRFVLVDEAQDMTLLESMIARFRGTSTVGFPSVTMVGDLRQGIFGWRGATAFQDVLQGYRDPGRVHYLPRSYRCTAQIASYANGIGAATGVMAAPIEPAPGASMLHQGIEASRLRAVVWEQVTLHGAGNVAVLCRTNHEAARAAAEIGDLARLIRRAPSEDLRRAVAAVRLEADPNDMAALSLLTDRLGPAGDGADFLRRVEAQAGWQSSIWSVALDLAGLDASALPTDLLTEDEVNALGDAVGEWEPLETPSRDLLDTLADRQEADQFAEASADGKVAVSTIHAAKGREWESVVLLTSRDWPGPRPRPDELKVLFVGATRASASLTVLEE